MVTHSCGILAVPDLAPFADKLLYESRRSQPLWVCRVPRYLEQEFIYLDEMT